MRAKSATPSLGKNFFATWRRARRSVTFEGGCKLCQRQGHGSASAFNYFFPFAHGPVDVTITFLKLRGKDQILIAVERRLQLRRTA